MKKKSVFTLGLFVFGILLSMVTPAAIFAEPKNTMVESVYVYCSVPSEGERLDKIQVFVKEPSLLQYVTPEEFEITGSAVSWSDNQRNGFRSDAIHPFTAQVSAVEVNGNALTLHIDAPSDKYYYVEQFYVANKRDYRLTFNSTDVAKVFVETADAFEKVTVQNKNGQIDLVYQLFTPEKNDGPKPLVLALHGSGDQENLLANRVATAFAEEYNQAQNPCYVMAPIFSDQEEAAMDRVLTNAVKEIKRMAEEGKVDPTRIYVVGKSIGGGNAIKVAAKYPSLFAGALALCPSAKGITEEKLLALTNTPLWLVQAADDPVVPIEGTKRMYTILRNAGSYKMKMTEYSPEQMAARGIEENGRHDVELVALEDGRYYEWLFAQRKEPGAGWVDYVKMKTAVGPTGQVPVSMEVYVKEAGKIAGLSAEDFTFSGQLENGGTFTARIGDISVEGNMLRLVFSGFPVTYDKVRAFQVSAGELPGFLVQKQDVRDVQTALADRFVCYQKEQGASISYALYGPSNIKEKLPIMVILRPSGDVPALLRDELALSYADSKRQAEMPMFVLVAELDQRPEEEAASALKKLVYDQMRDLVDVNKIYVNEKLVEKLDTVWK